jgi:hypothetical protein
MTYSVNKNEAIPKGKNLAARGEGGEYGFGCDGGGGGKPRQNKQKQGVPSKASLVAVPVLPCAAACSKSCALGFSSSWVLSSSG